MTSVRSCKLYTQCPAHLVAKNISLSSENESVDHDEENYAAYDDTVESVPTEEEAMQYAEQEEEEEQTLLARFSGEDDTRQW